MAAARGPFLAAVLLLVSSGLHCSSPLPACPESCTCQRAPLLNCSSSGLSLVPQNIQDSVTELDLSHNLLDSVTLDRPHHNLRNVWLGNNSITHLSLCIERNLGSQYVRGRHLHRLRPWGRRGCVSWAPTLQLLSVERNQLEQLPEGLEGSESLQVLQLSFNRISTLRPGDLSHLRQLKELHLQHNLITSLHPQMFQDLVQLRVLDLSFNMLTSLHPLMYLSLRNIGADVRLGGNRWQCDCSMRSLRRRMAYDSSRGLQAWSVVCASPSILSGRELLQLEEDDLNCFSTENRPELHQDVTVYSGSEILLSCSTQDSMWWTPSGQASVSQPQAGLLINDITERDTGLYVCVSEEHEVVSVFNLQISKIGGARRKTRSLPRTSQQIIPQGTPNRIGQERNQRATQSDLALAVCLSVFITFLIAFILGVLARPCIDVLWRRVTNKKSSTATTSVSSVEQRQYDNEAYSNGEEPELIGTHRERRVTFSTVDFREDSNVQYYDTVASVDQESVNNGAVIECEAAEAEKDTYTAGDSGSENSLQQNSLEDNQKDGRDLSGVNDASRTHNIEFEHIPDPVELEKRRSLSSCSDSSLSDKVFNEDQMTQGDHTTPKSPQLAEDSVQQRVDFSTPRKVEVPQISIEGRGKIPVFSSEPFADWSPHTNNTNLTDPDLWQENGEQFEFSDSVRSTSARSSSVCGSFNDSKLIVAPTSDKQKRDDMSSSSSYVSGDEPTEYTVNSDQEEEEDIERNHNKPEVTNACLKQDASFEQQIHGVDPIRPSVGFNQGDYRYDTQRPAVRPEHSFSSHSSDSDGENYTVKQETDKGEGKDKSICVSDKLSSRIVTGEWDTREKVKPMPWTKWRVPSLGVTSHGKSLDIGAPSPPVAYSSSSSSESEDEITDLKVEHSTGRVNEGIKINEPETLSTDSDSSSSDESTDETMDHMQKQKQGETHVTRLQFQESQTVSHDSDTQWPALDLEHIPCINRHLDIKAPSPPPDSSSSSDSEDETTNHIRKQEKGETYIARLPSKVSQTVSHDPKTQWPALDLENTTRIKRRLDIKAPSPDSDSSSSSDSEDETTGHTEKQRPGKVDNAGLPFQESQTESHDPDTRWPALDLEHTTRIKRHLDIKAPSPDSDSSSSSDSEDETTGHTEKQRPGKVDIAGVPFQESQTESHDPDTRWPALDLEHTTRIKRRLDIKAPSLASESSSSSDSEDETTSHIRKQEQGQMHMARLPSKVSQTVSHDPQTQWPAFDLEHTTRIKRRLDIKAPSPPPDSSSNSEIVEEKKAQIKKHEQGEVHVSRLPFQESHAESHDPETQWPALDLEHSMRIKRRLDIKAPSPPTDSSSCSDSVDETTNHIKKQEKGETHMARLPIKVSQTANHDPKTQWPALDLEHTTRIKRRLDIKAPSPDSDSSSSSDSEDETTGHKEKQRPGEVDIAELPFKKAQTVSHDPDTRWPALDLEHIPRIKRRLDIKASSPPPDSSSNSEIVEEKIAQIKKHEQGGVRISRLPFQGSQAESHDPETQWPALDLEHTTRIKRRLDIKAPSPDSDSSSGSDSEDETTGHIEKQRPGKVDIAGLPFQESQTEIKDPDTRWPALDLEHTTCIKRRLDIKAPSPPPDSSSSSDSEDETTNHTKKQEQGETHMARLPRKVSQAVSYDPKTQWPALDLEHNMRIKRRLDIKAPSLGSDSSSSSDSEDETSGHKEKQRPGEVDIAELPFKKAQTVSHDPDTRWPALDLEHIPRIKRRLDIKASSPPPDSSSNSEIVEEKIAQIKKHEQGGVRISRLPFQGSHAESHDPETQWPALDLEHTTRIKRLLDIKAPSPGSDSSSSSDSEDETTHHTKKERPGVVGIAGLPFQESQTVSHDPETRWPAVDLGNITRIKRRLDIKAASPPPDSLLSGGSANHTVEGKREEAIKISPCYSSSSSDEQEEGMGDLSNPPTPVEPDPDSRWPELGLSSAPHVKRRLDIKARSPPPESSSSSDESEGGTRDLPVQTYTKLGLGVSAPMINISRSPKTDHNIKLEKYTVITDDVGDKSDNISTTPEINPELQSRWATMNLGISRFRKRLEITSHTHEPPNLPSSPPPESPSSSSSESGTGSKSSRTKRKRREVGMQGIIHTESSLTPENKPVNVSLSLKGRDDNSGNSVEVKERLRKDYSLPTTEEKSNPDTMLTGFGTPHFRRYLDIKVSEKAPATPPLRQLPDSSSSSNSENETIDHSVPDLSLGVPRVKRRLNVKAPLPEPSNSPSSCSESENEVTGYTAKQSRHASNMSGMTDNDSLITYKRLIIKASSPPSNSFSPSGQTIDRTNQRHTGAEIVTVAQEDPSHSVGDRNTSLAPRRVPSMNFDDVVKKRIKQSRRTTDVDLPPEIRWTGIGRRLSDLSISSPRRHLDVGLSSPQQAPPAEPTLPPPDSSNYSSSKSDDKIKQDRGKADVTLMHKYSSLSANSVSLASSRALDKFDNSPGSTNEILRAVPEDKRERKGLSALKAMSSERQKWDTGDKNLDKGASPLFDDHGPQGDNSFNYRRFEEDIKLLAKQPLTQLHLSSTSVDERRATDLLYGIPRYRRHDIGDTEPPQEAPPPIPAIPPPDEAVGLTWRSPQSIKKQGLEGTRSYLQQSRNTEESDPSSLTSQNLAVYFDSSNMNFSDV